jgi:uncharacterized protein (DUF58 family)
MPDYRKYLNPEVLAKISRLELRARMVVEGFISGMHRSPYHGYSVEFASHREYVPGDDTRHIDWRLYARGDRLYIKQYEEETNLRTHILLDCSRSMAYPEHHDGSRMTKFDYACTAAASLVHLLVHQQDACGLVLFDHAIREQVAPATSPAQLQSMIELIEQNRPDHTTNVKMMFSQLAEQVRRRGLIILISDLLTDFDDIVSGLQQLRHARHDVIVLHVMDHDELTFPFESNTLFEGLEAPDVEVLTDPQSLRASYLRIVQGFVGRLRAACVNHRIDYRLISTHDPLDGALTAFLAARMHQTR